MPKLLHLELGRNRLGGTMQVYYLHRSLVQQGADSMIVTPKGSALHDLCRESGLPHIAVSYSGEIDLTILPKLIRVIHSHKPDVVHIHSRRGADTWGSIAARICRVKKIILARRVDDPLSRGPLNWYRYGPGCDVVVAVSKGIVKALTEGNVAPSKIRQVYSAIESDRYQSDANPSQVRSELGLAHNSAVIGVIAQLIPRKGHRYLLEAFHRIKESYPDSQLLFLGEGESEAKLRSVAESSGFKNDVIFAGYRDDIGRCLRAMTLLAHPATMEGFANVAMQAMAAGIPVVSADVGGMSESVRDGVSGILVPPRDPGRLAEAVISLLDNPSLQRKLGQSGRSIVEQEFTVSRMVTETIKIYRDLLPQ